MGGVAYRPIMQCQFCRNEWVGLSILHCSICGMGSGFDDVYMVLPGYVGGLLGSF